MCAYTLVPVGARYPVSTNADLCQSPLVKRGLRCPSSDCSPPLQELSEMLYTDRPDWQSVMQYVAQIYKYFET